MSTSSCLQLPSQHRAPYLYRDDSLSASHQHGLPPELDFVVESVRRSCGAPSRPLPAVKDWGAVFATPPRRASSGWSTGRSSPQL